MIAEGWPSCVGIAGRLAPPWRRVAACAVAVACRCVPGVVGRRPAWVSGVQRGVGRHAERGQRALVARRLCGCAVGADALLVADDHLADLGVVGHLVRVPVGRDQALVVHRGARTVVVEHRDRVVAADADQQVVVVGEGHRVRRRADVWRRAAARR